MKAILAASILLSACAPMMVSESSTSRNSININVDTLAYSQYVGLKWLAMKMKAECGEPSNINANAPLMLSRSEELLIYMAHKKSTQQEFNDSKRLVEMVKAFLDAYRREPDLKVKQNICGVEIVKIDDKIKMILVNISGVYDVPNYTINRW